MQKIIPALLFNINEGFNDTNKSPVRLVTPILSFSIRALEVTCYCLNIYNRCISSYIVTRKMPSEFTLDVLQIVI